MELHMVSGVADSISFQIIAPLSLFKSTVDTIDLEENIEIYLLSDDEINLLIQIGLCSSLPYVTARVPDYPIRYHRVCTKKNTLVTEQFTLFQMLTASEKGEYRSS